MRELTRSNLRIKMSGGKRQRACEEEDEKYTSSSVPLGDEAPDERHCRNNHRERRAR